jgi:carbamate kinase
VLTDVAGVYREYGTDRSELLPRLTVAEARRMIDAGELGEGSMGPKVRPPWSSCSPAASGP